MVCRPSVTTKRNLGRGGTLMGTGSGGGGGGGGSGSGGGGGLLSIGGYRFKGHDIVRSAISSSAARKQIQNVFGSRSFTREYVQAQFGSPLVRSVYEELFHFSGCLKLTDPCGAFAKEYGISAG